MQSRLLRVTAASHGVI